MGLALLAPVGSPVYRRRLIQGHRLVEVLGGFLLVVWGCLITAWLMREDGVRDG